ncbi:MAG: NAD(P)H-dependent oxidoreductase [Pseudomonadota bacterium]|nr:NAD(P)H-dependent oxidoreductase [Pseudomonadota bacterium]
MKTLLIVYHSMTGATLQLAQAAARGARDAASVQVRLLHAPQAGPADVLGAQAYVFATPENLASMAGLMKDFFDRCYYPALGRIEGRAYASLVCAGSDGQGAARQIERIATGWRLKAAAPALIVCTHAQTPEAIAAPKQLAPELLQSAADLGAALAAGMAMGVF